MPSYFQPSERNFNLMLTTKPALLYPSECHNVIMLGLRRSLMNSLISRQCCIVKKKQNIYMLNATLCLKGINNLTLHNDTTTPFSHYLPFRPPDDEVTVSRGVIELKNKVHTRIMYACNVCYTLQFSNRRLGKKKHTPTCSRVFRKQY